MIKQIWVHVPVLRSTDYIILFIFSVPQLPHIKNGNITADWMDGVEAYMERHNTLGTE